MLNRDLKPRRVRMHVREKSDAGELNTAYQATTSGRFSSIDDARNAWPQIVKENKYNGEGPAIDRTCHQSVQEADHIKQPEAGKNHGEHRVPV